MYQEVTVGPVGETLPLLTCTNTHFLEWKGVAKDTHYVAQLFRSFSQTGGNATHLLCKKNIYLGGPLLLPGWLVTLDIFFQNYSFLNIS